MKLDRNTLANLREQVHLGLNPVLDVKQKLQESSAADLDLSEVRAIFPLIKACTLDKPTKNYTCYTGKSARSKELVHGEETGYRSYVAPYAKPMLDSHNSYDGIPYGRVIWAGAENYKDGNKEVRPDTGTLVYGTGYIPIVAAVTDPIGIERVLNGTFHTVSIGVTAHKLICSISGDDILELVEKGDYPQYFKGQKYKINSQMVTNYWSATSWTARELSWVNTPADYLASTISKDIGQDKAQLLLSEKVIGKNEFKFYDFFTKEEIDLTSIIEQNEFAVDPTWSFEDSYMPKAKHFHFNTTEFSSMLENTNLLTNQVSSDKESLESIIENIINERKLN